MFFVVCVSSKIHSTSHVLWFTLSCTCIFSNPHCLFITGPHRCIPITQGDSDAELRLLARISFWSRGQYGRFSSSHGTLFNNSGEFSIFVTPVNFPCYVMSCWPLVRWKLCQVLCCSEFQHYPEGLRSNLKLWLDGLWLRAPGTYILNATRHSGK